MGIDISALSHLEYVEPEQHPDYDDDECQEDNHWQPCDDGAFPSHHRDLKSGCYSETTATEYLGFCSSATYHLWWRDQLSLCVIGVPFLSIVKDPLVYLCSPFIELICFTDTYGTIGPAVCGKLAREFAEHEESARKHANEVIALNPDFGAAVAKEWFDRYQEFKQAFILGAQGGLVQFS
jgi:hypothetical protein